MVGVFVEESAEFFSIYSSTFPITGYFSYDLKIFMLHF